MSIIDFSNATLQELCALAKEKGIKSVHKYRKLELIEKLKEITDSDSKTPPNKETATADTDMGKSAAENETPVRRHSGRTNSREVYSHQKSDTKSVSKYKPQKIASEQDSSADNKAVPAKVKAPAADTVVREASEPAAAPETKAEEEHAASSGAERFRKNNRGKYTKDKSYYNADYGTSNPAVPKMLENENCPTVQGILEVLPDGYGFLRMQNYYSGPKDIYLSIAQIRRFNLKTGDEVLGRARPHRENDKFDALMYIDRVNGLAPEENAKRPNFEDLIPVFPDERYTLEVAGKPNNLAARLIDLIAPIGKGQRAMIVSQPKAGKTTLLKQIAAGISENYPDSHLIVLLIDERPEEVTDMKRCIQGEVVYSTFDELPEHHTRIAEMVQERAMRLVEGGKDVVILLDSLTRLTRAYNLVIPPTGRTLSGGMDPGALHHPKRFFGAARNIENGGSLTVIATALVETGSRMDDIVYEEFKGTGNMEIHLDRKLSEKRVFPAIDIYKSGTRREDLLLSKKELDGVYTIRKMMAGGASTDVTEQFIPMLQKADNNEEFLLKLKDWVKIYQGQGYSIASERTQSRAKQ